MAERWGLALPVLFRLRALVGSHLLPDEVAVLLCPIAVGIGASAELSQRYACTRSRCTQLPVAYIDASRLRARAFSFSAAVFSSTMACSQLRGTPWPLIYMSANCTGASGLPFAVAFHSQRRCRRRIAGVLGVCHLFRAD